MERFSSLFFCQKLVHLIHAVAVYLRPLLRIIYTIFFRVRLRAHDSGVLNKDDQKINFHESELEDATECGNFGVQSREEDEPEEICLKFKFPTFEEFSKTQKETGNYTIDQKNSLNTEVVPPASISKFEITFADELENFPGKEEIDVEEFTDGNSGEEFDQTGGAHRDGEEVLVVDGDENEKSGGAKIEFPENSENKAQTDLLEIELTDENQLSSEKISMITDSDSNSTGFEYILPVMVRLADPQVDGFMSDGDFGGELDSENEKTETYSELSGFEDQDSSDDFSDVDSDIMEELDKLEEDSDPKKPKDKGLAFLRFEDFTERFEIDYEKGVRNGEESIEKSSLNEKGLRYGDENNEKSSLTEKNLRNGDENIDKLSSEDFSDDTDDLESLWEHQELIERLKMELKKVRATGLPTILEEAEPPKMMDDLKPWKIDEFQRENCSGGLHKFYKSYRGKMRKFDIINYQKMYAMGFLQLKDPLKSISAEKPSPPTLKSLVSDNLWPFKHKIHGTDPTKRLVQELQGELEAVYVGQMCLSWEFLHWQYEKVLDLWETDRREARSYNEVAGEFQQFQVLVQRFVEDEPFHGPRVQNYVETRCTVRNLLQVPIIREDNTRDKSKARAKATDEYVITSDMLVETVEESIRIFWKFVRADKDCSITSLNGHKKTPELPNPEDLGLWMSVKKILRKKDRKIKDILRSENCILRKLRQCREDDDSDDQVLYFFSQVDMKLVCRVLNMSRITRDQLVWCRDKLNRISFVNRRIHVEPSFLLFPC